MFTSLSEPRAEYRIARAQGASGNLGAPDAKVVISNIIRRWRRSQTIPKLLEALEATTVQSSGLVPTATQTVPGAYDHMVTGIITLDDPNSSDKSALPSPTSKGHSEPPKLHPPQKSLIRLLPSLRVPPRREFDVGAQNAFEGGPLSTRTALSPLFIMDQYLRRRYAFRHLAKDHIVRGVVSLKCSEGLVITILRVYDSHLNASQLHPASMSTFKWQDDDYLSRTPQVPSQLYKMPSPQVLSSSSSKLTRTDSGTGATPSLHERTPSYTFESSAYGVDSSATQAGSRRASDVNEGAQTQQITQHDTAQPQQQDIPIVENLPPRLPGAPSLSSRSRMKEAGPFNFISDLQILCICPESEVKETDPDFYQGPPLTMDSIAIGDEVKALVLSVDEPSEVIFVTLKNSRMRGLMTEHRLGLYFEPRSPLDTFSSTTSDRPTDLAQQSGLRGTSTPAPQDRSSNAHTLTQDRGLPNYVPSSPMVFSKYFSLNDTFDAPGYQSTLPIEEGPLSAASSPRMKATTPGTDFNLPGGSDILSSSTVSGETGTLGNGSEERKTMEFAPSEPAKTQPPSMIPISNMISAQSSGIPTAMHTPNVLGATLPAPVSSTNGGNAMHTTFQHASSQITRPDSGVADAVSAEQAGKIYLSQLRASSLFANPQCLNLLMSAYGTAPYASLLPSVPPLALHESYMSLRQAQDAIWAEETVVTAIELARSKHYTAAMETFRRALEVCPACAKAYVGLGAIFVHTGNIRKAVRYFTRAVELDVGNETDARQYLDAALKHLQTSQSQQGDKDADQSQADSSQSFELLKKDVVQTLYPILDGLAGESKSMMSSAGVASEVQETRDHSRSSTSDSSSRSRSRSRSRSPRRGNRSQRRRRSRRNKRSHYRRRSSTHSDESVDSDVLSEYSRSLDRSRSRIRSRDRRRPSRRDLRRRDKRDSGRQYTRTSSIDTAISLSSGSGRSRSRSRGRTRSRGSPYTSDQSTDDYSLEETDFDEFSDSSIGSSERSRSRSYSRSPTRSRSGSLSPRSPQNGSTYGPYATRSRPASRLDDSRRDTVESQQVSPVFSPSFSPGPQPNLEGPFSPVFTDTTATHETIEPQPLIQVPSLGRAIRERAVHGSENNFDASPRLQSRPLHRSVSTFGEGSLLSMYGGLGTLAPAQSEIASAPQNPFVSTELSDVVSEESGEEVGGQATR